MNSLNTLQRELINQFQGGFPPARQSFSCVAASLGTKETNLIQTLQGLLHDGYLSRFGPLYNAEKLGGDVTLAAMAVDERRYNQVADVVNTHAEVAHNYRRDHALNMWFVLACEQPEAIENTLRQIERETGIKVYNFPRQRGFYLGLFLHLDELGGVETVSMPAVPDSSAPVQLDAMDRKIIAATQSGLPLVPEPWQAVAQTLHLHENTLLQRIQAMQASGVIRRIGVIPNHYRLGLKANGMSVWDIPADKAAALGEKVAALDFVSHCYLRPRYPGVWPYNLFAMVHGVDRHTVLQKAAQIEALLGPECHAHEVLFSSAILKKTGFRLVA